MNDETGRNIEYLRLSVTDRCNLRCEYCMPAGGVEWITHDEVLRFEEIVRLVKLLAGLGIKKVKITGGEPLVRKALTNLIANIKQIDGIEQVTLTTNGVLLKDVLDELVDAGVSAVNISLDSLNHEVYEKLTGFDSLDDVLAGIEAAAQVITTKINTVPILGVNDKDLVTMAGMAKDKVAAVRFIELMPVGWASHFKGIPSDTIKRMLAAKYGDLSEYCKSMGNGPAEYYSLPDFNGKVGFIHAMSEKFCSCCNRVRLTSDGQLMPCLGRPDRLDLRAMIRAGALDGDLIEAMTGVIQNKPEQHAFLDQIDAQVRDMNTIGG